jgi:hypothetical protein
LGESWEQPADRALYGRFQQTPEPEQVTEWVEFMPMLPKDSGRPCSPTLAQSHGLPH